MNFLTRFFSPIYDTCIQYNYFRLINRYLWPGLIFFLSVPLLVGCQGTQTLPTGAMPREETVTLPTLEPTPKPSPVSTRVLPVEVLTPPPTPTITPIPDEARGLVVDVIDGDTIVVVMDGDPVGQAYEVRYLGIDAPVNSSVVPWGVVAYEVNRKLTNLKVVRLVRDQTDFDSEGRLLRYVYVDNQLMSIILTEQGLAKAVIEDPNTQFEQQILEVETRAKKNELGLWSKEAPTPTVTPGEPAASDVEPTIVLPIKTLTATITATVDVTLTITLEPLEQSTVAIGTVQPVVVTGTITSTPEATVEPTLKSE